VTNYIKFKLSFCVVCYALGATLYYVGQNAFAQSNIAFGIATAFWVVIDTVYYHHGGK